MNEEARRLLEVNAGSHWWNLSKDRILFSIIKRLDMPRRSSVLELGVGVGSLISALDFDRKVGIDSHVYKNINRHFEFIRADITRLPILPERFDLLLLVDVIEHIKDDKSFMRDCFNILKPNGKVVIFTPAIDMLWSDLDEMDMHFRRYTLRRLKTLLASTGVKYKLLKSTYVNFFLFPGILIVRLMQKIVKKAFNGCNTSLFDKPNALVNSLLMFIFSSERFFLSFMDFPIGSSCLCIAEKESSS